jgi:hypothetical protein
MLPGLARLHGYGYVVDVAAVRAADLQCGMGDWRRPSLLHGAAKDALNSCISGEGEPPLELTIAAVACAGFGFICGIPVQQMREDSVTELDLSNSGLHAPAAMLVAYLIPATSVLKNCNLLKDRFDVESAKKLSKIGAEKGIVLSGMKRNRREAKLQFLSLQPADAILIASDLQFIPVLTGLDLRFNRIGDEGVKAISESLKVNAVLTRLDLRDNDIGDDGAKSIAEALKSGMSALTSLGLVSNNIGDDGAKAIAEALKLGMSVLTTLYLNDNNIGDDGAKSIAEALKSGMSVLTTLWLSSNEIGDEGAKAIADALKSGTAVLTSLGLGENNIGVDGAKAFGEAVKVNAIASPSALSRALSNIRLRPLSQGRAS